MKRRQDPRALNGGWQLDLFPAEAEPATAADPARPTSADWARLHGLDLQTSPYGSAVLSPCGTYRYQLTRIWDENTAPMVWVMLNPSTADHASDDATIRRCISFAKRAGHGGMTVVNLFALRSTNPRQLREHPDPIGLFNESALINATENAARVALAWGDASRPERAAQARSVTALLTGRGRSLECLGLTGKGHPRHPLYLPDDTKLTPWRPQTPNGDRPLQPATTVVDLHGHQGDPAFEDVVYVGRPMYQGGWRLHGHLLANPFKVGKHGNAAAVVERYRRWLTERPDLVTRELPKLKGKRLGCWCPADQPCHARVLAELADATEVTS